jgi:alpha-tubulin suppressor-like RCC1 family protein
MVELFEGSGQVVQVAAGASYTFAVTDDGTVHSFGSCTNFCLGHGDQHNELRPRAIQSFKRRNIHVVRVSAGDEHAVALDALGCSALCRFIHGVEDTVEPWVMVMRMIKLIQN